MMWNVLLERNCAIVLLIDKRNTFKIYYHGDNESILVILLSCQKKGLVPAIPG